MPCRLLKDVPDYTMSASVSTGLAGGLADIFTARFS
jgi:hypothetical protein